MTTIKIASWNINSVRARAALVAFKASPGPVIPHRIFGPLARDEWDRLQLIHLAHHLSFAVPKAE